MGATLLTRESELTRLSIESNGRRVFSGAILVGAQPLIVAEKQALWTIIGPDSK
jgi:hypothetical protein